MIITQIDEKADLFLIEDVLPQDLINEIDKEDFLSYNWEEQRMQSTWNRRRLLPDVSSPLTKIDNHYNLLLNQIEDSLNISFEHRHCWSSFWLDYEGFDCSIHEDGAERGYTPKLAMQIYLTESADNLGTTFYYDENGKNVRYQFKYKKNSGYLQLNRPGQWHGMLQKVPPGHRRLSSYTYFGQFNDK